MNTNIDDKAYKNETVMLLRFQDEISRLQALSRGCETEYKVSCFWEKYDGVHIYSRNKLLSAKGNKQNS